MRPKPFLLERYFNEHEFGARYLMGNSDCESFPVDALLGLEDDADRRFRDLRLGYIEPQGTARLREAIASLYSFLNADSILVTTGAQEAILIVMQAMLDPNDHVIVQSPTYQSLYQIAKDMGCVVSLWEMTEGCDNTWTVDVGRLQALLHGNTRLIVINSPNNPTGHAVDAATLESIVTIAERRGILLVNDEAYRFMELTNDAPPPLADLYDRAISIGVMSKAFGLAGLRIGWVASKHRAGLERMREMKYYTSICNSAPSEFLASLALRHKERLLDRNRAIVERNLGHLSDFFSRHRESFRWSMPDAGTTSFPRLGSEASSDDFCSRLLEQHGVLLTPSTVFEYGTRHVRVGFGRANFVEGLAELDAFVTRESGLGRAPGP